MLIKILKPFSLQGKKYKVDEEFEIKDQSKIPTEPCWFNRLQDKDIEIVEKGINKKGFSKSKES